MDGPVVQHPRQSGEADRRWGPRQTGRARRRRPGARRCIHPPKRMSQTLGVGKESEEERKASKQASRRRWHGVSTGRPLCRAPEKTRKNQGIKESIAKERIGRGTIRSTCTATMDCGTSPRSCPSRRLPSIWALHSQLSGLHCAGPVPSTAERHSNSPRPLGTRYEVVPRRTAPTQAT